MSNAPISTRKNVSLVDRVLNVGFVKALTEAVKTKNPPSSEIKYRIENADKTMTKKLMTKRDTTPDNSAFFRPSGVMNR